MAERDCALGIVAEPYRVPEGHPCWAASLCGSAAITWRPGDCHPPCSLLEAGKGFVVVGWGRLWVVGVYISPSLSLAQFEEFLDRLEASVRRHASSGPGLVAGDLNAWSTLWGSSRTNRRGEILERWAAGLGLVLLNTGSTHTFVGHQGSSVVDLTWATPPAARLVKKWRVAEEVELLSDHLIIEMVISATPREVWVRRQNNRLRLPRWALARMVADLFHAAIIAGTWAEAPGGGDGIEQAVKRIRGIMSDACDVSMPRSNPCSRRATYWWGPELAQLRRAAIRGRRQWTNRRAWARRHPGAESEGLEEAYAAYREARRALGRAIVAAKGAAWDRLLQTLEEDPWGSPYKMVLGRLRPWAPTTEALDPRFLTEVVATLFPIRQGPADPIRVPHVPEWDEVLGVSQAELQAACRKLGAKKAPGPDGLHGRAWALAMGELGPQLEQVFTACLRTGRFPQDWKVGRLVLLPKPGKKPTCPEAFRPICLLDEAGKILERIVAARVVRHLSRDGPDLHADQYGFREGRSTVDAILRVRSLSEAAVQRGKVLLAVSLDIANAFNTLPWEAIGGALEYHRVPPYLRAVIADYFRDRCLLWADREGHLTRRGLCLGVPQGSVLGPLLWDLGYDRALRAVLPLGCHVVGYADDTIILAEGETWQRAVATANMATACVVGEVRRLGLKVAPHKTQAVFFHDRSRGAPPTPNILVDGVAVTVGAQVKYLGLTLDGRWAFEAHFAGIAARASVMAAGLGRIMPNLGGPGGKPRRLYANVITSVIAYGAPVWAREAAVSRRIGQLLRQVQRRVAIRVARCYRTVSWAAAAILANQPPLELVAKAYAEIYRRTRELRAAGVSLTPQVRRLVRDRARAKITEEWRQMLLTGPNTSGRRTVEAIGPCLEQWIGRAHGGISFHASQVLTGHGCFGEYLRRIGKEDSAKCWHCPAGVDSAQHTLADCPAWCEQRRVLMDIIGEDLSLPAVVRAMLATPEAWSAFLAFCGQVMALKEEAERIRRGEADPPIEEAAGGGGGNDDGDEDRRLMPPPPAHIRPPRGRRRQPAHLRGPPEVGRRGRSRLRTPPSWALPSRGGR